MVMKHQRELQELQSQVVEENSSKLRLQMEADSKDSEIEQLQLRLASLASETASLSSGAENDCEDALQGNTFFSPWTILFSLCNKIHQDSSPPPHDFFKSICLYMYIFFLESRLEGWLSVPNKQNIRRHGWKKQYIVVSSKKIIFYNSENEKINADPVLILDLK